MEPIRFVVSDLHIGQNDAFDIFRSDTKANLFDQFVSFCTSQAAPVEVVINGDFVDFLQLEPWNEFGRTVGLDKARRIVAGSQDLFTALGKFLKNKDNQIVVLLGNHDVELAYPEVWEVIKNAILREDAAPRLRFLFGRTVYRVAYNGVGVHIEHGNADDPWNSLDYSRLFTDAETQADKFDYPPGTKFVYDVMNTFKEKYRFVDLLKPEMPAVLFILMALDSKGVLAALPAAQRDLVVRMIYNAFLQKLRQVALGGKLGPVPALAGSPAAQIATDDMAANYAAVVNETKQAEISQTDIDMLEQYLKEGATTQPLRPTLAFGFKAVQRYMVCAALRLLERFADSQSDSFFQRDHGKNMFAKYAAKQAEGNIKLVVLGHTHEALQAKFSNGCVYVNSGTWANLVQLPEGNEEKWLETIEDNTFKRTAFPTYVKIAPTATGLRASLNLWRGDEHELWQTSI